MLRELHDGTTEIETLSWWVSTEAIIAFAGADFERARYYPDDGRFLLSKPEFVTHYEVVADARNG
ncbi:hypothetical protein [Bosea robiniae]|uniref:Antibiotic biosynthesis monooxygenase n=1 Tax=Bosea robiniae TaxID=1036780 RepID=A0ABY0P5P1_9HYPH|nr:hypothetical protein [Bosea robiniae]SDH31918.1 hypothetical protein SAMN05421844_10822 [Bosea robiniae]